MKGTQNNNSESLFLSCQISREKSGITRLKCLKSHDGLDWISSLSAVSKYRRIFHPPLLIYLTRLAMRNGVQEYL